MSTKLVVCSLILKPHVSKCHLEVVALSLIICLEGEEMAHVKLGKETKKSSFVAGLCFCFFLDAACEFSCVGR